MLTKSQFEQALAIVLDHITPTEIDYRLVGTGAALVQGVSLPVGDIDILVKARAHVDTFTDALSAYPCPHPPTWMPHASQYYAETMVKGVEVGFSTVEAITESDGLECVGRGPWDHYHLIQCGSHSVPAVALELRLVSELVRNRPDRYEPLIQYLAEHGCDIALIKRGMAARKLPLVQQDTVLTVLSTS